MSGGSDGRHSYVQKVRQDTQQYLQELLQDNRRLQRSLAGLESEHSRALEKKVRLQEQLLALREELASSKEALADLQRQLSDVEGRSKRFTERYVEVEEQNNNLANLYVASYRLHETLDQEEVLSAIQEIVINLIGSEELAIFEIDAEGGRLDLLSSFGIDEEAWQQVPIGSGIIGSVALSGESWTCGNGEPSGRLASERDLTACIPLRVERAVTGVVAVFRLLPQKVEGLEVLDHELFDLLATQAGAALYFTRLHQQTGGQQLPKRGVARDRTAP